MLPPQGLRCPQPSIVKQPDWIVVGTLHPSRLDADSNFALDVIIVAEDTARPNGPEPGLLPYPAILANC